MHSKLSFTAHHIRRTYFQTENKYLILFQFEKEDSTMVKEHKKKKKKSYGRPELLYFHKVISIEQNRKIQNR